MSVLLITYELSQKDAEAEFEIENRISYYANTIRLNKSSWLVETDQEPGQVLNHLEGYFDSDDQIFVFKMTSDWEASAHFDQLTWLENNLEQ